MADEVKPSETLCKNCEQRMGAHMLIGNSLICPATIRYFEPASPPVPAGAEPCIEFAQVIIPDPLSPGLFRVEESREDLLKTYPPSAQPPAAAVPSAREWATPKNVDPGWTCYEFAERYALAVTRERNARIAELEQQLRELMVLANAAYCDGWSAVSKLESQILRDPSLPEAYTSIKNDAFAALYRIRRWLAQHEAAALRALGKEPK